MGRLTRRIQSMGGRARHAKHPPVEPCSKEEMERLYWTEGMTQAEIAKHLKTSQKVVFNSMRRYGIPRRAPTARDQRREKNGGWKGGKITTAKGYVYVLVGEHPRANESGYVAEHILVAERATGKPIGRDSAVHHINFNKKDNRPANLAVGSHSQHQKWHRTLETAVAPLLEKGVVKFDKRRGYYAAI